MKVLVAVLTYQREETLRPCLRSIHSAAKQVNVSVDVVIGDNDPQSVHQEVYIPAAIRLHVGLGSVAAGRQALLSYARSSGYDYIAFIDDDELVSTNWLRYMLMTALDHPCSAVAGPVSPTNVKRSQLPLHARARRTTGTNVRSAGAGNLMLNLDRVRHTDFDTQWKLPGGEDTDFTLRLSNREGPIVWCDEAEVFEPVAASRLSKSWLSKRYFSNGRILCHAQRSLDGDTSSQRIPLRLIAIAASGGRLLVLPFSAKSFRYFLDNGVRNMGFIYEALRRRQPVIQERSFKQ